MYVRIGARQRALFARAAKLNPERFGTCAVAPLATVNGLRAVDLSDIAAPTPTPDLIQRVFVEDPGTSTFTAGTEVVVVTIDDRDAELPPRCLVRDRLLLGVEDDLDLVTSIEIYYSRLPDLFLATDRIKEIELDAPYDTLLEVDLAKWLLGKATQLSADAAAKAMAGFTAEEATLLTEFYEHVRGYAPAVSRFSSPRIADTSKP